MAFEKTYVLNDCHIHVRFHRGLIGIESSEALHKYLSTQIKYRSNTLVEQIKLDYQSYYQNSLNISNRSVVIEIWGHIFAGHLAKRLKNFIPIDLVKRFADLIINRCNHIDCGETGIDSNRIIWDLLSPFQSVILFFVPKRFR